MIAAEIQLGRTGANRVRRHLRERPPSIEPSRQSEPSSYIARAKADEGRALNACFFSGIYRAALSSFIGRRAGRGWSGIPADERKARRLAVSLAQIS
jgi:hypothetical protein